MRSYVTRLASVIVRPSLRIIIFSQHQSVTLYPMLLLFLLLETAALILFFLGILDCFCCAGFVDVLLVLVLELRGAFEM